MYFISTIMAASEETPGSSRQGGALWRAFLCWFWRFSGDSADSSACLLTDVWLSRAFVLSHDSLSGLLGNYDLYAELSITFLEEKRKILFLPLNIVSIFFTFTIKKKERSVSVKVLVASICLFVTPWAVAARFLCPWNSSNKNTGVDRQPLLSL